MNRTKDELLQSCIEQFKHIDEVNENETLASTESLIKEIEKAINYSRCCTELNHDFKKGDDVWITSKKLVTIADFTECGKRVQVEDGCNYYLVDIDEITKVV